MSAAGSAEEVWETNLPPPTVVLTTGQIESFRSNGFLAIDRITTDEELEVRLQACMPAPSTVALIHALQLPFQIDLFGWALR